MRISKGIVEDGIIVGNVYDKYGSRNPIVKYIMKGFEKSLLMLVNQVNPRNVHEVGCGEGYWVINWCKQGIKARGSDVSKNVIELAISNACINRLNGTEFLNKSIYDLSYPEDSAELVVCCEVLEHLDNPEAGLTVLSRIANPYLIVSVPREPIWKIMNIARGKYLSAFGNTPGHLQHWTKRSFIAFVSKYFEILEVRTPLPWTMLLCRRKVN